MNLSEKQEHIKNIGLKLKKTVLKDLNGKTDEEKMIYLQALIESVYWLGYEDVTRDLKKILNQN